MIRSYVAKQFDSGTAKSCVQAIVSAARSLEQFPEEGKMENKMNHIKIETMHTTYGQKYFLQSIDGKTLPEYLQSWADAFPDDKRVRGLAPFSDLWPAWSKSLEWEGDVRFVWKAIELDKAVLPLLLCPDDVDFTCIVVVAEVEKTEDFVYWNRVGFVLHDREEVNSPAWCQWISENWAEELYRRRMNYTLPFYRTEGNVFWMKETNWVFDRSEYENMVQEYWEMETWRELQHYRPAAEKLAIRDGAKLISGLTRDGWEALNEHLWDYGEILLHLFAAEQINEPLLHMLEKESTSRRSIEIYCKAIELLWQYGDDAVVNVVDVTILERLSDDKILWQRFGAYISEAFRTYINTEVLTYNLMMGGVAPL